MAAAIKPVYTAANAEAARAGWTPSPPRVGKKEPLRDQGFRPVLGTVHPVLAFPRLRRVIYTTNSIESLNYQMRKVIRTAASSQRRRRSELLWLAICNIEDKRAAERAKERAQKRCRTAPDDSWKDRWSPTGRKHSNSSCWSTPTASSHTCRHCWKAQQTKIRQPTYIKT